MSESESHRKVLCVRRVMFIAACVGIVVASYLAVTYVRGTPIACGPLHGCETVRASRWASWWGIPTPFFGLAFYTAVIAILVVRNAMPHWKRVLMFRLTRLLAALGFIESTFLFFIQLLDLKAFCTWCLGSALAATTMFVLSWFDAHPEIDSATETKELRFQFIVLSVLLVADAVVVFALALPRTTPSAPTLIPAASQTDSTALALLNPKGLSYEGPAGAKVTLIEFTDFECPACRHAYSEVEKVLAKYAGKIRFAYREFPLPIHPQAKGAAVAAVCADHQGKLYPYANALFAGDPEKTPNLSRSELTRMAGEVGLNTDVFSSCLDATSTREAVARDITDGAALDVTKTPTFFVNDMMIDGLPSAEQLGSIIDQALQNK